MAVLTSNETVSHGIGLSDAEAFRQSEASVRLEGIDPNKSQIYVEMKERVLAGEITSEEAVKLMAIHYRGRHVTAA